MPNKKEEPEFVVQDRRRFTAEGELVEEKTTTTPSAAPPEEKTTAASASPPSPSTQAPPSSPTAEERAAGSQAYEQATGVFDEQLKKEISGAAGEDFKAEFKAGFERVVEPLYVTALMQLGYMGQENQSQRRVDIIGARVSIDTLILLQEKTKGNLAREETALLEDVLYDLRMKYLEITNALARAAQNPPPGAPGGPMKP